MEVEVEEEVLLLEPWKSYKMEEEEVEAAVVGALVMKQKLMVLLS